MESLDRLNEALQYIESGLTGEIDINEAAKICCCSTFYFQRMFSFITDVTLSEYIRRRRMTLAAFELQNSTIKIIDLALKYGYESPTSFTRAFINMHGVTPSAARELGVKLKAFPRMSFHISIKGDAEMNYRMEEKAGFRVVGVKEKINMKEGNNFVRIPQMWNEVMQNGAFEQILNLSNDEPTGVVGVCAGLSDNELEYYIASSTNKTAPENMSELKIPAATWAIFECVGPLPDSIQNVTKRIFSEWFPSSNYEHAMLPEIEWYSDGDTMAEDYKSEVWMPVVKKK